jgi:hypothetical protein
MNVGGVLKNVWWKDTINSIMKTPGSPKILSLQIPGTISEGRWVKKDIPLEIQWDEKQKSYVYASWSAQWLRPFIKDGMMLGVLKNTASDTKVSVVWEKQW